MPSGVFLSCLRGEKCHLTDQVNSQFATIAAMRRLWYMALPLQNACRGFAISALVRLANSPSFFGECMFKTLALVLTLSLTAFGGTNEENRKAFYSLPLIENIKVQLASAVGEYRAKQKIDQIATRWDHTAMMSVVAKWVAAEKETNPTKKLRAKELVKRRDLEVEAEIWRRILGKGQEKPFIANESQREAVVKALAGDDMIRSLSEDYRNNLAQAAEKLAKQKELEAIAQAKKDEALEASRIPKRLAEQESRAKGLRNQINADFADDLLELTRVSDAGPIGSREGINNRVRESVPADQLIPIEELTGPKSERAPGDLPQRDLMREQILKEIERNDELLRRHGEADGKAEEETHKK